MTKEAMDILQLAEGLDSYRTKCAASPINTAARQADNYELETISPTAASFLQNAAADIPLVASICEIAILDSSADSGLPHTRPPNLICLPASMCKDQPASNDFKITLLHEAIHVHQRLYPDIWKKACKKAGWKEFPSEKIPETIRGRIRINPDTMATPYWSWDDQVPLPIFQQIISPKLPGANIEWYDIKTGAIFHKPPASLLSKTAAAEATGAAVEHPYELYADRFSRMGVDSHDKIMKALENL
jgi:hypothetical protein